MCLQNRSCRGLGSDRQVLKEMHDELQQPCPAEVRHRAHRAQRKTTTTTTTIIIVNREMGALKDMIRSMFSILSDHSRYQCQRWCLRHISLQGRTGWNVFMPRCYHIKNNQPCSRDKDLFCLGIYKSFDRTDLITSLLTDRFCEWMVPQRFPYDPTKL